jgi:CubicO group peptidase (beta-lactamase class C family)
MSGLSDAEFSGPETNPAAERGDELLPATRRALMHRVAVGQADGRAPSLAAAVSRSGRMAWSGVRRMSGGDEPGDDIQYRIGSLTKTFVAVLVMRLREEGLLDLADPLGKHLDAPQAQDATVAQLLSHTSGLAAEADGPWWERTPGALRPELADIFGERPRPHPAGRVFHYSNPGYALLGALVAQLRGQDWERVLREEILEPLGMTRTTVLPQPPHERGWAVHPWADVLQPEPAMDTGRMRPAADLWSTTADLCRFAAFLIDGDDRVLPASTLAEMRAPASGQDDPSDFGYGLGIQILHRNGRTLYGHLGSMPGFVCGLWVSPADRLGGIALANATTGPDTNGVAADLIKIVAEYEPPIPAPWRPLAEADQALLALTGLWYWGPRPFALRLLADRWLDLAPAGGRGRNSRFRAEADGTWTGLDGYYAGETLRLVPGPNGEISHIDVGNFVFTRQPYGPASPLAAQPDPHGWQPG